MESVLLMTFGTESGRARTLRVNNVNTAITDINVRNAMNAILTSSVLKNASGYAESRRSAVLQETTVIPINV